MRTELVWRGLPVPCVVLELCSYGASGDFQVLPMSIMDVPLEGIHKSLVSLGRKAAVTDGALFAEIEDVQLILNADGRAVMEHVAPCLKQTAWDVYVKLVQMKFEQA